MHIHITTTMLTSSVLTVGQNIRISLFIFIPVQTMTSVSCNIVPTILPNELFVYILIMNFVID